MLDSVPAPSPQVREEALARSQENRLHSYSTKSDAKRRGLAREFVTLLDARVQESRDRRKSIGRCA